MTCDHGCASVSFSLIRGFHEDWPILFDTKISVQYHLEINFSSHNLIICEEIDRRFDGQQAGVEEVDLDRGEVVGCGSDAVDGGLSLSSHIGNRADFQRIPSPVGHLGLQGPNFADRPLPRHGRAFCFRSQRPARPFYRQRDPRLYPW
ncbi:hypothetical protein DESC_780351 [Desulfosarcina cetonica]|nr:hypothetical protein DESC_780351 [Desulfosarcina cetonica]